MTKAQSFLEIGALGGYSEICLARGLNYDGTLLSLELEEKYAQLATIMYPNQDLENKLAI